MNGFTRTRYTARAQRRNKIATLVFIPSALS